MDKISDLPDELLIKILSFVPTKAAVSTSILSKRWKFLWMWLSNLEYSDDQGESFLLLRDFINKNLPLHKAPVIERLCLELWEPHDSKVNPEDIKLWVETAISRYVRELEVSCFSDSDDVNMFPSSFFTCESVVVLKLRYLTLKDVPSTGCCLPSLKTLQLESLTYVGRGDSLQNLFSMCHLLEDLEVRFLEDEYPQMFTVIFPVLRKLTLSLPECEWSFDEYEIDTPLLEYLKLEDWNKSSWLFKNTIPNLREAHVHVDSFPFKSGIGSSFTSVKHLNVCSELEEYGCDGFAFDQLEHLELCVCKDDSLDLLAQLLKDSPNIRVLDISILDCHGGDIKTDDLFAWYKGSCVPECMLPSLQVFNWSRYIGRPRDRDMAVYILRNAPNLRTATFKFDTGVPNAEILKMELTRLPSASSTCELVFFE